MSLKDECVFQFTFANEKKELHPFNVKSNLETAGYIPGVTQSVAISLESYLDEVKLDLSESTFTKFKDNFTKANAKP